MIKNKWGALIIGMGLFLISACQNTEIAENPAISSREWNLILKSAQNTEVLVCHSEQSGAFEKWMKSSVAPLLLEKNIKLKVIYKPQKDFFEKLATEKEKRIDVGSVDLFYVQEDNYKILYEGGFLYTSFLEKLPHYYDNIDPEDYEFSYEQGIKTLGSHIPVTRSQLAFVYDEDMIEDPPQTMELFLETLKTAPGQFTFPFPEDLSGKLFMQTFIAHYVDYKKLCEEEPKRDIIATQIEPALKALKEIKPKLWKEGTVFPKTEQELDQMFFEKKIAFSLTTDPNKPVKLSKEEKYPYAARGFVLDDGTAGLNGGMVILHNAPNKSGAMIALNEMISAKAQADKYDPKKWGNIPVVDTSRMNSESVKIIQRIGIKRNNVKQELFNSHRLPEMPKATCQIVSTLWKEVLLEKDLEGDKE